MSYIKLKMKSGSTMEVECSASFVGGICEELTAYWPGDPRKIKRKNWIIPPSLYDTEDAEQKMWDIMSDPGYGYSF